MTDEQLREALADAFSDAWDKWGVVTVPQLADAAIALMRPVIRAQALEEAARVAEAKADEWATVWRNRMKADSHMEGKSDGADEIAAAIRALKEKNDE